MCDYPYHSMSPELLSSSLLPSGEIHINSPIVRIPGNLPVEVEATQELHPHVQPEACVPDPNAFRIPSTLFDQCACACNVVHPLQSSFRHYLVDIEYDRRGGDDDCISVRVLHLLQKEGTGCRVVISSLRVLICRVD